MSWTVALSLRMLRSRKKRGLLSPMALIAISGIAFGIVATLISLSVVTGFQEAYQKAILGFNAHIVLIQDEGTGGLGDWERGRRGEGVREILSSFKVTEEEIAYWEKHQFMYNLLGRKAPLSGPRMESLKNKGIVAMTPFVFKEGLGIFPDGVSGVVLKGVDPQSVKAVYPLTYHNIHSLEEGEGGPIPPVIVGVALHERLFPEGAPKNATIKLLIPKGEFKRGKIRLKDYTQSFKVVGTFESGLYEFDSQFILTSLSVVGRLFKIGSGPTGIELRLDDPAKAPSLARLIEEKLPPTFQAISWDELNESLFYAMKMEKNLFAIIMFLILLIASFNVMGSILMLLLNRRSDIAILLAMGASRRGLNRVFALQGFFLGMVGLGVGLIISALFLVTLKRFQWFSLDPQIYFISHLPVEWPLGIWVLLGALTLILCYFVSQIASKMVIRYGSLIQTFR